LPSRSTPAAGAGGRLAEVVDLDRRRHGRQVGSADERGLGNDAGPQPPLGRQSVVGVMGGAGPAVAFHHGDGTRQGVGRGHVGVDHPLGLAVVLADAHLEHRGVGVDDGPGHFEPQNLAAEDAVLDDGLGARGADDVGEGGDVGVERRLGRQRLGLGSHERRPVDAPDGRRTGECGRPAGEQAGAIVDDNVQVVEREPLGPEQCPAQGARRLFVSEHPTGAVLDERRSPRKPLRAPVAVAPVPLDEGAQLGLAKGLARPLFDYIGSFGPEAPTARIEKGTRPVVGYFFFPPRAP